MPFKSKKSSETDIAHHIKDEWQYDDRGNKIGLRVTLSNGQIVRIGEWKDQDCPVDLETSNKPK